MSARFQDKHGPSQPAWVQTLCAIFTAPNSFTKGCKCDTDDESSQDEQDDIVYSNNMQVNKVKMTNYRKQTP